MDMIETVMAQIAGQGWTSQPLSQYDKNLIRMAVQATIMEMGPIIKASWEDEYPPELAPYMVKGRKLFRKNRLIERTLAVLPVVPEFICAFVELCGEVWSTGTKEDAPPHAN